MLVEAAASVPVIKVRMETFPTVSSVDLDKISVACPSEWSPVSVGIRDLGSDIYSQGEIVLCNLITRKTGQSFLGPTNTAVSSL